MPANVYILPFRKISSADVASVGGKNASLGEMYTRLSDQGISVPDGFAILSSAYARLLQDNHLSNTLQDILDGLDRKEYSNLAETGSRIRDLVAGAVIPVEVEEAITESYNTLCREYGADVAVAVRSSATAEDLPGASFAGQHESFLNISGRTALIKACQACYVSLFSDRAIKYREDKGFDHMKVLLSIGVQKMVRSDLASSGVAFTLEPESGFRNIIHIAASWGLGENIVKGTVNPDEYYVFKPTLVKHKKAIVSMKLGSKEKTMILSDEGGTVNVETSDDKKVMYVLPEDTIETIARWSLKIEEHYGMPMDIEWAVDGPSGKLFIVQARPETIHASANPYIIHEYNMKGKGVVLAEGKAIGSRIATGVARILNSPAEIDKLGKGEVLVTGTTNPDWDPVMKKASALVTETGGRTSHAAIVARELGLTAVVGTQDARKKIRDGQLVTVSCAEGKTGQIYEGAIPWEKQDINFKDIKLPRTKVMMILGDPDQAYRLSFYPNNGVGLMRLEFVINNVIGIHPMALVHFNALEDAGARREIEKRTAQYKNKEDYFTARLSQAVATIASAFYPKDVIVRMSDFKTNEYANLVGGKQFEPAEENPMLGFRGASRYYHERYRDGFRLECEAMRIVREDMGFENVKLMIPFCRTVSEARKVIEVMEEFGLKRGENGLQVYVMAEIPSNVLRASEFATIFDGFSIGSNDLTQLTLGIDRDSVLVSDLFDENDEAAKDMISMVIQEAVRAGVPIGLCGQAPSDSAEFARFLVEEGIDSISFNPDALIKGIENIVEAEKSILKAIRLK